MEDRSKILHDYVKNMVIYLETQHGPNIDRHGNKLDTYEKFIKEHIKKTIQIPKITNIVHNGYGNSELAETDLLSYIKNTSNKIITPSGSIYETADKKRSLLKQLIDDLLKQRKVVKKKMLDAEGDGRKDEASLYKNEQATIKIATNSLIGAMGSAFNCFYDLAGFNSVTSISRHAIMLAYTHTERLLEGNFYLPTNEHILNHLVILKRCCPPEERILSIMKKHNLYIPEAEDVLDFLLQNKHKYTSKCPHREILTFLENSYSHERCFYYYFDNLKNLFRTGHIDVNPNTSDWLAKHNSDYFIKYFTDFYNIDNIEQSSTYKECSPFDLYKLDEDLLIIMGSIYSNMLEKVTIFKAPTEKPDVAMKLYNIGLVLQERLDYIKDVIDLYTDTGIDIPQIAESKDMIRNTVIVSDTDSVIFTTKNWINWFTGRYAINHDAFKINSLMVYYLSKTTAYMLTNMSKNKGATGKDIKAIEMKNEFLYNIYMNSPLKKHYAGIASIQEGRRLPEFKKDIKGVNLRSSKVPHESSKFAENFIVSLMEEIDTLSAIGKKVSASSWIMKVVEREQKIMSSLKLGEVHYLTNEPIKDESSYKNADSSLFFNYTLWQEVFAYKYGEIQIPSKCHLVPINDKMFHSESFLDNLTVNDPELGHKLKMFLSSTNKKVTRLIMNPMMTEIPKEIIPIIDYRSVIFKNCSSLYLVMRSLGLGIGNNSDEILFSDYYL